MSRDGSGTFTLPTNSWNPAVEGTEIDESDWNSIADDLETALTESVFTSGLGSTDNVILRTDGTGTKKAQGSALVVDDSGNLSGVGYVDIAEISAPFPPAANSARLYVADDSGTTRLYMKDSAGTATDLTQPAVADGSVTNAKLADMSTARIKGRTTSGSGAPEDLTGTQATALLDAFMGDSGSGGVKGLVPAPASGDGAAGKVLYADGTWAEPPGATGGESNTASNLGAGEGVFSAKSGVDLRFKSLVEGSNITLTSDADTITITGASGGETNTASNLGSGSGFFASKSGVDLQFKSLLNGAGLSRTSDSTSVTLDFLGFSKVARAYATSSTSCASAAWTIISFQAEDYDTAGLFSTGSPTYFTIPAGVSRVLVWSYVQLASTPVGTATLLGVARYNSSDVYQNGVFNQWYNCYGLAIGVGPLAVNENDRIKIRVYHNGGSSRAMDMTDSRNHMAIACVG